MRYVGLSVLVLAALYSHTASARGRKPHPIRTIAVVPAQKADTETFRLECVGATINLPGPGDYTGLGSYPGTAAPLARPAAAAGLVCAQGARVILGEYQFRNGAGRCGRNC